MPRLDEVRCLLHTKNIHMKDHFSSSRFEAAIHSDVGLKRKQNQDFGGIQIDHGLFILADGMGGHQGGETASKLCVEKITESFEQNTGSSSVPTQLHQSILAANQAIFDLSQTETELRGMGTTTSVVKIDGGTAYIAQVGDSRVYYWNSKGIWQLTQDHSLVQEKLRAGLITREQLESDNMKNVITRSVGYELNLRVDLYTIPIESGDGFLLCSDGVSNPVAIGLMFDILGESFKSGLDLSELANRIIQEANERSGDDNATVILVKVKKVK